MITPNGIAVGHDTRAYTPEEEKVIETALANYRAATQPPLTTEVLLKRLGEVIRKRRRLLASRATLQMMAEGTGISLGYLSQIELGKNSPSLDKLRAIATFLGTPLSLLLKEAEEA